MSKPEIGAALHAIGTNDLVEFTIHDSVLGTGLVTFIKDGVLMQLEFNLEKNHWCYRPVESSADAEWKILGTGLLCTSSLQDMNYDGANMAGEVWMLIRKMRLNAQI